MLLDNTTKVCIIYYVHVCMHLYTSFPYSQTAKAVPHLLFPLGSEQESCQQLVSATTKQTWQNPLGTPEHIATFVVNTLFNVILGATYGPDVFSTEPKKITVWFETYR